MIALIFGCKTSTARKRLQVVWLKKNDPTTTRHQKVYEVEDRANIGCLPLDVLATFAGAFSSI